MNADTAQQVRVAAGGVPAVLCGYRADVGLLDQRQSKAGVVTVGKAKCFNGLF